MHHAKIASGSKADLDFEVIKFEKSCSQRSTCIETEPNTRKNSQTFNTILDQDKSMNINIYTLIAEKLEKREAELRKEFAAVLEKEKLTLINKFDAVLENEQMRTSFMLQEAYRDRKEKIEALHSQMECKNLAALMCVLATERRKSKLEKLRMSGEYTNYIEALRNLLRESQDLILNLSRGYKTAARVDQEWREKARVILGELQNFIHNFAGGEAACNQYFIDFTKQLETKTSLVDDPKEDPCDPEEPEKIDDYVPEEELIKEEAWWEKLDTECRPFVTYGDMSEFKPPQRRQVLAVVKGAKSAPKCWKEYVFDEKFLQSSCQNVETIKYIYAKSEEMSRADCLGIHNNSDTNEVYNNPENERRNTATSTIIGGMGSILKMITGCAQATAPQNILAAKDSLELLSTTILKERSSHAAGPGPRESYRDAKVVLEIKNRKNSLFIDGVETNDIDYTPNYQPTITEQVLDEAASEVQLKTDEMEFNEEEEVESEAEPEVHVKLGPIHKDSLRVISSRVPDIDAKINYEKICPSEKCKRGKMDSFLRSLPPYMKAGPYEHIEVGFENYEPCSPEQLEVLRERIKMNKQDSKTGSAVRIQGKGGNLEDWSMDALKDGVAVQTSELSLYKCNCLVPNPSMVSGLDQVIDVKALAPKKLLIDSINEKYFFDDKLEMNRFRVIGGNDNSSEKKNNRNIGKIESVLKLHPSICDILLKSR